MPSPEELVDRFSFHPAMTDVVKNSHEMVRYLCRDTAISLNKILPGSRERSLALTKLEEVMFWANAAIAREREKE